MYNLNEYQTPIEELDLESQPQEILDWFHSAMSQIPMVRYLTSADRPRACDLPKDENGRIIVDVTKPHILENMDYFRKAALHYQRFGTYTDLRPNPNPNSEWGKWIREEIRRCYQGMVRPSDGEWIPGDLYYLWNYAPMQIAVKVDDSSSLSIRKFSFPDVWEGHYLKAHMIDLARKAGKHYIELASRSRGKSYYAASMLARRYELGETNANKKGVTCYITAYEKKYLDAGDQTLNKFQDDINFFAKAFPEMPHLKTADSLHNMQWTSGYKDTETGVIKGMGNSVIGITSKDDEAKLRGTRGVLYIIEEAGNFPRLKALWQNLLPSVEYGNSTFGIIVALGTAGDTASDFEAMQEMMYHPDGYHIYAVDNVYDKIGDGTKQFGYFFPAYMNLGGFYNKNGVSDITRSLLFLFQNRYLVKYGQTDQNMYFKAIAELPITPQEATLRTKPSMFPVADIRKRINELDNGGILETNIVGDLVVNGDKIELLTTTDLPIRKYQDQKNNIEGAIEFFELPKLDKNGKAFVSRYIAGVDPIDADSANTSSLFSIFVMDVVSGLVVCEWTGRLSTADECYERARRICLYYNAQLLIENNKIGIVAYFKTMGCLYMLAETPEWLYAKDIIKTTGYGNRALGVNTTLKTISAADERIKQWLMTPYTELTQYGEDEVRNLVTTYCYTLKSRALLEELMFYNPEGNFDRVRAFGILMLYYLEHVSNHSNVEEEFDRYNPEVDEFLFKVLNKKQQ